MYFFHVYSHVSEPAAYAACALKELGLQPKDIGQRVSYAIFDFGGGTTDFDFGVEEKSADRHCWFVLHQFDKGGDVCLGGENLLNLMAYEVYKDNLREMRSNSIPFALPPDAEPFAGAERLVYEPARAPQQAYMNRRKLAELMRPIWEKHEGYQSRFTKGDVSVQLYSLDGERQGPVSVKLMIKVEALEKLIERRIGDGVDNFFIKLSHAFFEDKQRLHLPIHILLAGNSCRSPVVRDLFRRKIEDIEKNGQQILLENRGEEANLKGMFALHLPLGMREEAASDTRQPGSDKAVNDEAPLPGETLRKKIKILQAAKEAAPNSGVTEAAPAAGAERFVTELDRARRQDRSGLRLAALPSRLPGRAHR